MGWWWCANQCGQRALAAPLAAADTYLTIVRYHHTLPRVAHGCARCAVTVRGVGCRAEGLEGGEGGAGARLWARCLASGVLGAHSAAAPGRSDPRARRVRRSGAQIACPQPLSPRVGSLAAASAKRSRPRLGATTCLRTLRSPSESSRSASATPSSTPHPWMAARYGKGGSRGASHPPARFPGPPRSRARLPRAHALTAFTRTRPSES